MKNLREGLVGEWLFDGDAKDTSGQGNDGVIDGVTLTTDRFERLNRAYLFDGNNDSIDAESVIDDIQSSTTGTISAWIEVPDTIDILTIFNTGSTVFTNTFMHFVISNKKLEIRSTRIATVHFKLVTDDDVPSGSRIHVAVVQNGTEPVLYLNGIAVAQTFETSLDKTYWWNNQTINTAEIGVRVRSTGPVSYFNGTMDEVKLWTRNLSADEIFQEFSGVKGNYQGLFEGLAGAWDFNKDARDWSGNELDGTATGTTSTTDRFNVEENARSFNGSSDYITTGKPLNDTDTTYSVAGWFKMNSLSAAQVGMAQGNTGDGSPFMYLFPYFQATNLNSPAFFIRADSGGGSCIAVSPEDLVIDTWYHMVGVRDGDDCHIYIDGELSKSETASVGTITTNNHRIGNWGFDDFFQFNGMIDEPMVWSRALSVDEVKALYNITKNKSIHTYVRDNHD